MNRVLIRYQSNNHNLAAHVFVRLRESLLACLYHRENYSELLEKGSEHADKTGDWLGLNYLSMEQRRTEALERLVHRIRREFLLDLSKPIILCIASSVPETSNKPMGDAVHSVYFDLPDDTPLETLSNGNSISGFRSRQVPTFSLQPTARSVRSVPVGPPDHADDPPDDFHVEPEPARFDRPGLSEQSLHTYFEAVLHESPESERQQLHHLGRQLKARRQTLRLSRLALAEQLECPIETLALAENGYGEVDSVRDLLDRTRHLQNEVFRYH
jgi:hypothetical protein